MALSVLKPIWNANKTAPNQPGIKTQLCCIWYLVITHEEYPNPETKKNTVFAKVYILFENNFFIVGFNINSTSITLIAKYLL